MVISADELYEFYAQLGQALYAVQIVEGSLHKMLAMQIDFAAEKPTAAAAERILDGYRSKTLGQLIGAARKHDVFSEEIIALLEQFNGERRFVVHRLQDAAEQQLRANTRFRNELLARLAKIADAGFSINKILLQDMVFKTPTKIFDGDAFKAALARDLQTKGF